MGRKTSETNPETGTITYTYDSDSTCGSYPGDLVKIVDQMGNATCMTYDKLHRITSAVVESGGQYYSGTQQTYYVYDTASNPPATLSNTLGNLAEAYTCPSSGCSGGKLTDMFFSVSGNSSNGMLTSQVWESTPNSGHFYMTEDTYYPNGTVGAISAAYNGNAIGGMPSMTYGVDGMGRLLTATDTAHSNQKVTSGACYTSGGQVAGVALGNGDSDIFSYDPKTLRPTSFQYNITGSNPFNIAGSLTWNANASLAGMNLADSSDSTKNQNCTYSADGLQRLVTVNCTYNHQAQWAQTFSYDPFGNISKQGSIAYAATYAAGTNQENNGYATYDQNGDVTTNSRDNNYGWNAAGQPISVNGISATYDALGRMVETNNGGSYTQYIYRPSGGKFGAFQAGAIASVAVPLPGGLAAVYSSSGLNYVRHMDYLGSSRLATTWGHSVYSKEAYAPFGEPETTLESGNPDRVFTGQEQATTSGVYDYMFRRYDPTAGRWLSPDPAGWAEVDQTDPQSLNRYAYVENNPMSYVDFLGLGCTQYPDIVSGETGYDSSTGLLEETYTDYGPNVVCTTDALQMNDLIPYGQSPAISLYAPSNGPSKPGFFSCTFTGKVGLTYGETALDAIGIIPGGNDVVHGIQLGAGIIGAGISVFGDATGAGLSAGGLGLAFADKAGASIAVHGTELIPIAGNIISAGAALHDVFGGEGMIAAYKSCMAGTN